jgi:hypothetical protein
MSTSKKIDLPGTLRQVFIRVYRLEIQSVKLVLRPSFVTVASLTFSLVQPPPPTLPCVKVQYCIYRQCVAGRGWVVLSPVGNHILQEFNILYLTRLGTYKLSRPPLTKLKGR